MKYLVNYFLAVIFLVLFYVPNALAVCGLIDDWVFQEVYFGAGYTPKEGGYVVNDPETSNGLARPSSPGTYLVASYSFRSWTDVSLLIKSFGNDAIALAEFEQWSTPRYDWFSEKMYEWTGTDIFGWVYPGDNKEGLIDTATLGAVYRGNTVVIKDVGLTELEDRSEIAQFYNQLFAHAKSLIDQKCGGNTPNHPPSIVLTPSPDNGLEFQKSIAKDGGFGVVISDPDGLEDIDYTSLRIYNTDVDITTHFLNTTNSLPITVTEYESENSLLFTLRVDRYDFMYNQNLFNIPWNGKHNIKLKICDIKGECSQSTYDVYIGPFITAEKIQVDCANAEAGNYHTLELSELMISNIGYTSKSSDVFLALKATDPGVFHNASGLAGFVHYDKVRYGNGLWLPDELLSVVTLNQHKSGSYDLIKKITLPLTTEVKEISMESESMFISKKLTGIEINQLNVLMAVFDRELWTYKIETMKMAGVTIEPCDL